MQPQEIPGSVRAPVRAAHASDPRLCLIALTGVLPPAALMRWSQALLVCSSSGGIAHREINREC
eukprot:7220583-Karenia_brevis.AAC.1